MKPLRSLLLLTPLLSACFLTSTSDRPDVCTAEYRVVDVHVLTEAGAPVVLDDVTVRADGEALPACTEENQSHCLDHDPERGRYEVMNDILGDDLDRNGSDVEFAGRFENEVVDADFLIAWDGCHVNKLAGPDTLVVD